MIFTKAHQNKNQQVVEDPRAWTLEGPTFQDGSAKAHQIKELARAAWGIVLLDAEASKVATVSGPVWWPLPQTSAAAEWLSYTMLAQFAGPAGVQPHQDYLNLVKVCETQGGAVPIFPAFSRPPA